jgi:hypothetical protein
VNQPGLKRLPLNANDLNKALASIRRAQTLSRTETCVTIRLDTASRCINRRAMEELPWTPAIRSRIHLSTGRPISRTEREKTPTFNAARNLATKLNAAGEQSDIAGYSKGGRLAQEAGLVSRFSRLAAVTEFTNGPPFGWVAKASVFRVRSRRRHMPCGSRPKRGRPLLHCGK